MYLKNLYVKRFVIVRPMKSERRRCNVLLYKKTNIKVGKPKCITILQNTHNEKEKNKLIKQGKYL